MSTINVILIHQDPDCLYKDKIMYINITVTSTMSDNNVHVRSAWGSN